MILSWKRLVPEYFQRNNVNKFATPFVQSKAQEWKNLHKNILYLN